MPDASPSLKTVQRAVSDNYKHLHEGQFCFDDLLQYLESYNAPKMVSIGEDATRVMTRIEYDGETNQLVGFVLPCDSNGLPQCNTFTADSFQSIETSFRVGTVAKYACFCVYGPTSHSRSSCLLLGLCM